MIQALGATYIEGTPEDVFRWIEDPQRVLQWVPQMISNEHLSVTGDRVGTEFQQQFQYKNRVVRTAGQITAFKQNELLSLLVRQRRMTINVDYRLKPVDAGTVVTQDVRMRFRGWAAVAAVFCRPLIAWIAAKRIHYNLAHLKKAFESSVHAT